jgi:hypothetical protein
MGKLRFLFRMVKDLADPTAIAVRLGHAAEMCRSETALIAEVWIAEIRTARQHMGRSDE